MVVKVISIEGAIAAGKSTLLSYLRDSLEPVLRQKNDRYRVHILEEPLDRWVNISGHNLLAHFYKDKSRWSVFFQMYAFISRVEGVENIIKTLDDDHDHVILMERSWPNDRHVFAHLLYEEGSISEMEWKGYCELHDFLISKTLQIDRLFYLLVSPDACVQRKCERDREEERMASSDYIKKVSERYLEVYRQNIDGRAIGIQAEADLRIPENRTDVIEQIASYF